MTKAEPLSISEITKGLPPVEQYGFAHGGNSAAQSAFLAQKVGNEQQSALNNNHSGGSGSRIVVPQAPTHGMPAISPVCGNSNSTHAAKILTQGFEDKRFDNMVGKGGGKSRKKRRYRNRKSSKRRKVKKISRKKRTKRHRKHKSRKSRRRHKRG